MRRCLTSCFVVVVLFVGPVFAQVKAKAQNVPEIPYESVPNFLKLPPGLYMGEAVPIHACSSLIRVASMFAKSVRGTTASSSRTQCVSTRRTTSGPSMRERTWSSSSIPRDES